MRSFGGGGLPREAGYHIHSTDRPAYTSAKLDQLGSIGSVTLHFTQGDPSPTIPNSGGRTQGPDIEKT